MDKVVQGLLLLGLLYMIIRLGGSLRRAAPFRQASRASWLDECRDLLQNPREAAGANGFPRMSGEYRGLTVDLQAVPDSLSYRKLPALWLLVSVVEPLPLRATLDLMKRPSGLETFSHFASLQEQITPPPGFPADCVIRTNDSSALPPAPLLTPHLAVFDEEERVKELVISPKGLRLVWLVEEADRTRYLIFRDSELGAAPLDRDRAKDLLDRLVALHGDLIADADIPLEEAS